MVFLFMKNKRNCITDPEELNFFADKKIPWPMVTIQLPVYNEYYVIERLIDSVSSIDYPKEKLEIQVLDDSTDETRIIAEKKVSALKKQGFKIKYIHRENREGHKAGALKNGLESAKGEFIAMFDADFMPKKDFLKKTIPYFYTRDNLGMVQARWGHTNPDYSVLTKAQAIGIDGHFVVEQTGRNASNLWMNFNGTAGIWRKECILDAGNWHNDTLTEDLDLSYRALLKNWRFHYILDHECPAELPPTISAFKNQQFRWAKGSLQTAKKLLMPVLKSRFSWKIKVEAVTHLFAYSIHPLMVLNILLTLPVILIRLNNDPITSNVVFFAGAVMTASTFAPFIFYAAAQKALYPDWKKRLLQLPFLTMIGTGIGISNTKAWIEAMTGKKSGFVRTPKLNIGANQNKISDKMAYTSFNLDIITILEILMGLYIAVTIAIIVYNGLWILGPFLLLYASGFFYVSFLSVAEKINKSGFFRKRKIQAEANPDLTTG
jgi:cellulose synthase/poly-beta-1,6-N-acetylglucosamine synthase-like glycosyltransferase